MKEIIGKLFALFSI